MDFPKLSELDEIEKSPADFYKSGLSGFSASVWSSDMFINGRKKFRIAVKEISSMVERGLGYCVSYKSHAFIESKRLDTAEDRYVYSRFIGVPVLFSSPEQAASNVAYVMKYARSVYGGTPRMFAPCTLAKALLICAEDVECRTGRTKKVLHEFLPGKFMIDIISCDSSKWRYQDYIKNMYASSLCMDAGLTIHDLESRAASNRAIAKDSFVSSIQFRGQDE